MSSPSVLIVGAGMAGLTAAGELQSNGIHVTVLDKGRGFGGRMATRRLNGAAGETIRIDHGAQFFTTRSQPFTEAVRHWQESRLVRTWCHGFPQTAKDPSTHDGHPRYMAIGGMSAIAKFLASTLDVRREQTVREIAYRDEQWQVETEEGATYTADSLLLTMPVPQALQLCDTSGIPLPPDLRGDLNRITYDPCLAVMAVLDGPSGIPAPGAIQLRCEPVDWIADARMKGTSEDGYAVVIHAAPGFSTDALDGDRNASASVLLQHCQPWIQANVVTHQVHGWRFAAPTLQFHDRCLLLEAPGPLAFAGDGFGDCRVEGAFLSGRAAAEALSTHWRS